MHGRSTSDVEVTGIAANGFRILLSDEELFVSYSQFPWFRTATTDAIRNIEHPAPDHLYWPDLDVDVSVESIRHPNRYPLVSSDGR